MFGYITDDLNSVDLSEEREIVANGHDIESLLYGFLDEWLFQFNSDLFLARQIEILDIDLVNWRIRSRGFASMVFVQARTVVNAFLLYLFSSPFPLSEGERHSFVASTLLGQK